MAATIALAATLPSRKPRRVLRQKWAVPCGASYPPLHHLKAADSAMEATRSPDQSNASHFHRLTPLSTRIGMGGERDHVAKERDV